VTTSVRLGILGPEDLESGLLMACSQFGSFMPERKIRKTLDKVDPELSLALRNDDGIVGVYLISEQPYAMASYPFRQLDGRPCLCGDALILSADHRGVGYGRLLRAALPALAKDLGKDYVWGMALTALGNREDWLSRRALLVDGIGLMVTAEPIAEDLKEDMEGLATVQAIRRWYAPGKQTSVSGKLMVQELANGEHVPWVLGAERVARIPPNECDIEAVLRLEGCEVEVSGTLAGERFTALDGPVCDVGNQRRPIW
jgi:hypothetical protein